MRTDIDQAISEWSTTDGIDSVLTDLNEAGTTWNEIEEFASTLAQIQYNFDPDVKTASGL